MSKKCKKEKKKRSKNDKKSIKMSKKSKNIKEDASLYATRYLFFSVQKQMKDSHLADKRLIVEIVSEVPAGKCESYEDQRFKLHRHNDANPENQIFVPEIVW